MKSAIIMLVLLLSAPLLYAGDGDLTVDGNLSIGTPVTPSVQLTSSTTIDPSTLTSATSFPGTPTSRFTQTTLDGPTAVHPPYDPNLVSVNSDYVNIPGATVDYGGLWVYLYSQYATNYNPFLFYLQGIGTSVNNYANIATSAHPCFMGASISASHLGTGTAQNINGLQEDATIQPPSGSASAVNLCGTLGNATISASAPSTTVSVSGATYGVKAASTIQTHSSSRGAASYASASNAFGVLSNVSTNHPDASVGQAFGLETQIDAKDGSSIGSATGVAIRNGCNSTVAGSFTTVYGVNINNQTSGTSKTYGIYSNNGNNYFGGGNVGIGADITWTGGSNALVFYTGAKPTALQNSAGLYAKDDGGTTRLWVFDETGNDQLVTPHSVNAPDTLYDAEDGLPMIVEEVQHFLGYVRYTNVTRQSRIASIPDAGKSALSAGQRTCVYMESFADHNARLGLTDSQALVKLDWYDQQQVIKARRDAEIAAATQVQAKLTTALAACADDDCRANLTGQSLNIVIPPAYVIKDPPPRLRAALDAARW